MQPTLPDKIAVTFSSRLSGFRKLNVEVMRKAGHVLLKFDIPAPIEPFTELERKHIAQIEAVLDGSMRDLRKVPSLLMRRMQYIENRDKLQAQASGLLSQLERNPNFEIVPSEKLADEQFFAPDITDDERSNTVFLAPTGGKDVASAYNSVLTSLRQLHGKLRESPGSSTSTDFTLS